MTSVASISSRPLFSHSFLALSVLERDLFLLPQGTPISNSSLHLLPSADLNLVYVNYGGPALAVPEFSVGSDPQ